MPWYKLIVSATFKKICFSFLFKIITPLIMLIITPKLINGLGVSDYGNWSLIITTVSWLTIFDFGIANQLRNNIKILIHNGNTQESSNVYTIAAVLSFAMVLLFVVLLHIANINNAYTTFLVLTFFIVMQSNLCRVICLSLDMPEYATAVYCTPSVSLLIYVLYSSEIVLSSLMNSYLFGCVLMFLFCYFAINRENIFFLPKRVSYQNLYSTLTKYSLFKGGLGFFSVQIVSMILLLSDRYMLAHFLGSEVVAKYDLLYKISNVCVLLFSVINMIFWSKFTELWISNERVKIKRTFIVFDILSVVFVFSLLLIMLNINSIFSIWLGGRAFEYSSEYILGMVMYLLGFYFMSAYSSFLNGIGKLKIQFSTQVVVVALKVIVSLVFIKSHVEISELSIVLIGGGMLLITGFFFRRASYATINI